MTSTTLSRNGTSLFHHTRLPLLPCLLLLVALVMGLFRLSSTPPLWWDEGWTLTVARTWVERGHYGRLLDGEPVSVRLAGGFPVIAPIALSFRLFGVGVWQGRVVGVGFTLGALALIYYLASRLYDRSVAVGTLAVLLFMSPPSIIGRSPFSIIHPVLMGRQILGEMPALFYLLAAYTCFLLAMQRTLWFMPLAVVFWGIALRTKAQVLPFWTVSLLIPLGIMLVRQRWKTACLIGTGLLASLVASRSLLWLQQTLTDGHTIPEAPIHGLYGVTALVPVAHIRIIALLVTLTVGLPTLLGLSHATWRVVRNHDKVGLNGKLEVVRLALFALAGSWLGWYVFLSVGWPRYVFPAMFIGSIFVAVLLRDLTNQFSLSSTVNRAGYALRYLRFTRQGVGALLAIVLISTTVPGTLRMLHQFYTVDADTSALQVADYLNSHTVPTALIESYDSELFFLLNRRYHYPPDQISVELLRRYHLGQDAPIDYDPLAADPDYLVVGLFSREWQLYDPVLATGAFRLRHVFGLYEVYERVY
jgi:4-amino-4-deoxy-L-arabinose transferase-like glycosyltransferase